jgi:antitoxin HicB
MQREYTAFFEANEHGGYTVTVPALPGLVTEGKDLEHARVMAKDAIQSYILGLKKAKDPFW